MLEIKNKTENEKALLPGNFQKFLLKNSWVKTQITEFLKDNEKNIYQEHITSMYKKQYSEKNHSPTHLYQVKLKRNIKALDCQFNLGKKMNKIYQKKAPKM